LCTINTKPLDIQKKYHEGAPSYKCFGSTLSNIYPCIRSIETDASFFVFFVTGPFNFLIYIGDDCIQSRDGSVGVILVSSEAEFLDEIQTKVLKVFLLAIHSHLYSFSLRFIFLQAHETSPIFLQTNASYVFIQ
jgi:hypothetical protein